MAHQGDISAFLAGTPFAVVGASRDRAKYGNKVLRAFVQQGQTVYPVNPQATEIEGLPAFASLDDTPELVHGASIVTPPSITEQIVDEAIVLGIDHLWMQPGAESAAAIDRAVGAGINVIAGGPCILVALGYTESA